MGFSGWDLVPVLRDGSQVNISTKQKCLAALAGVAGLYLSYYAGTAGGASVALAIVAVYLLSLPLGQLGEPDPGCEPDRSDDTCLLAEEQP